MSSVQRRLATFAFVLAGLFAIGVVAGQLVDPEAPGNDAEAEAHGSKAMDDGMSEEGGGHGGAAMAADPVRGLGVAEHGLRLVVEGTELRRGAREQLRFRIVGENGKTVRDFDVEHTKRMHLIVARRDLQGFQHLHPAMAADGTWTVPVRLDEAGSYRLFADFSHDDEATTLAGDLRVDGRADLKPLPAPTPTSVSDGGYDVRLEEDPARPGAEAELRFSITKDGRPVGVEPYLGADGHLVALREGDLAFLHVHPTDEGGNGRIGFEATFPTAGRYRLFLQFKVDGRVETVAFTQEVS